MARTRFVGDAGLTARMTLVMFLLGGLFVGLVVVLMSIFWYVEPGHRHPDRCRGPRDRLVPVVQVRHRGDAAMGAREVSPEQAPELHGMIDRLCALADMPKPRVGIADTDLPNAFATGRSPQRSVVVVTTGILKRLDAEELEGVLAHELSHVAHRDVLVMTVASRAGIIAGMLTPRARSTARSSAAGAATTTAACRSGWSCCVVSLVTYAISFLLLKLLSRYRELSADRAGAYLTMKPHALASALQKITGDINQIPDRDLRPGERDERVLHRPGRQRHLAAHPHLDAPDAGAAPRAARADPGRAAADLT